MKRKVLLFVIISIFTFAAVQISLKALNNNGYGEQPYMTATESGVIRWASDVDGPLSTSAGTSAATVNPPGAGPDTCVWSASGIASYNGNNDQHDGEYDTKAEAVGFTVERKASVLGTYSEYAYIVVTITPLPDGQAVDIDDCAAHGDVSGTGASRSEIPW